LPRAIAEPWEVAQKGPLLDTSSAEMPSERAKPLD
jgi:hypothetical protein